MPSQWIFGAPHPWCCTFLVFVAQLEKFWQWPTFHINQLHGSDTAIEISRVSRGPKYADQTRKLAHSGSAGGREGGRLTRGSSEIRRGIEFQMRGARKSFLAPVPHLYFMMTLFFEFINISRAEFLGKHLKSHTVQISFLNWPQCNFRYCIFVAAFLVVLKQIVLLKPSHGSSSASVLSATAKMLEHLQAGTGITP